MTGLVYQNDEFIVIDKAPGVSFHSEDGTAGLFEQVKAEYRLDTLFPVHRLDKITSGLVIFAKTQSIAAQFGELFENHQVEKFYLAISTQKPKKKQGWVKGDMVKARRGAYKLVRSMENPAVTQFISLAAASGQRLYLLKPHSGKTHQLRVALKSLGAPIVGDALYGGEACDRGYLHAYGIKFTIGTKDYQFIKAPTHGALFCQSEMTEQLSQHWPEPWTLF